MAQKVYFVGTQSEVGHHAAPLLDRLPIQIASSQEVLKLAQPKDLAIFFSEHFDRFRQTIIELKERRVATLYMIDGILEWRNAWENDADEPACPWTMRPALADKVACIGSTQVSMLNYWGNSAKTELVGIPRFDALRTASLNETKSNDAPRRILVMSAKCPGFTEEQVENAINGFSDLKDFFDSAASNVMPLWRLTGELDVRIDVDNRCDDLSGSELREVLQQVDAVITTPSTAMLEASLMGLPVAILDYNNAPHLVPAAWRITSQSQIHSVVQELLNPAQAKMDYQKFVLDHCLVPTDDATSRLVDLINGMLEICHDRDGSEPVKFPSNLLGPVDAADPINLATLFPQFEEFQNADLVELQSQAAHSRREIKKLESRIEQLESELGQAHEIFDQIQNHPIAGPVVRMRQKLIDWMAKFRKRNRESTPEPKSPVENKQNVTI